MFGKILAQVIDSFNALFQNIADLCPDADKQKAAGMLQKMIEQAPSTEQAAALKYLLKSKESCRLFIEEWIRLEKPTVLPVHHSAARCIVRTFRERDLHFLSKAEKLIVQDGMHECGRMNVTNVSEKATIVYASPGPDVVTLDELKEMAERGALAAPKFETVYVLDNMNSLNGQDALKDIILDWAQYGELRPNTFDKVKADLAEVTGLDFDTVKGLDKQQQIDVLKYYVLVHPDIPVEIKGTLLTGGNDAQNHFAILSTDFEKSLKPVADEALLNVLQDGPTMYQQSNFCESGLYIEVVGLKVLDKDNLAHAKILAEIKEKRVRSDQPLVYSDTAQDSRYVVVLNNFVLENAQALFNSTARSVFEESYKLAKSFKVAFPEHMLSEARRLNKESAVPFTFLK